MVFQKGAGEPRKDADEPKVEASLQDLVLKANARKHADGSPAGYHLIESVAHEPKLYYQPWSVMHTNPDMTDRSPVAVGDAAIRAFLDK